MNMLYWIIWVVQARNKTLFFKYDYSMINSWVDKNENTAVYFYFFTFI